MTTLKMDRMLLFCCGLSAFVVVGSLLGCNGPIIDPSIEKYRQKFLSDDLSPAGLTIGAAKEGLSNNAEVTITGRIAAGDDNPFDPEKAMFVLSELPEEGHDHDAGDCPFCKRKEANSPIAIVQFSDGQGNPINIAADKLFGLKQKQHVTVVGDASIVGDQLIVSAKSLTVVPN